MRTDCGHGHGGADIPLLERLCYFFGQLLGPEDLRAEQAYFVNRLGLLTRAAIGWGVACGLDVRVPATAPAPATAGDGEQRPPAEQLVLETEAGVAVDCRGELLVLRRRHCRRLGELLGDAEREALLAGRPLYVSIEHVARPVHPSTPAEYGCDPLTEPQYGRIRDEVRLRVDATAPQEAACDTCEMCLAGCPDRRILLAVLTWDPGTATASVRVDGRRPLARHRLATVTGLGWVHGGTYGRRAAERMLERGVGVRFSRPVHAGSLRPGVVDLVVYEGGRGRRDNWYVKDVTLETRPAGEQLCDEVWIRLQEAEGFNTGDRILLVIRSAFVLDECCRALSGMHLGGGVPLRAALTAVDGHPDPQPLICANPPDRAGDWQSGNGAEGGTFESWIWVGQDPSGGSEEGSA
ncbi:hypothetical protein [Actinoplanes sp. NPDC023714]|uniref:hypothetical protein n=1 Tax=Actinoplanes sp. NPDC023714 TaxID=3154322 RepID=UPI0033CD6FFC